MESFVSYHQQPVEPLPVSLPLSTLEESSALSPSHPESLSTYPSFYEQQPAAHSSPYAMPPSSEILGITTTEQSEPSTSYGYDQPALYSHADDVLANEQFVPPAQTEAELDALRQEMDRLREYIKSLEAQKEEQENALQSASMSLTEKDHLIASLNERIKQLQKEYQHLANENAAFTSRVKSENDKHRHSQTDYTKIQSQVEELHTKLEDLKQEKSKFIEKIETLEMKLTNTELKLITAEEHLIAMEQAARHSLGNLLFIDIRF